MALNFLLIYVVILCVRKMNFELAKLPLVKQQKSNLKVAHQNKIIIMGSHKQRNNSGPSSMLVVDLQDTH